MIPARIYRHCKPSRIIGYLSTVWGGIAYTRSLERDLEALNKALKATEKARDEIAAERDRAWSEITNLEIERDAAEMRADAYESGAA
jgi:uncharacterized protein (DUF3084 family)